MFAALQHVIEIKAPAEAAVGLQMSVSYSTTEASILGRISPMKSKELITTTGQIPQEIYEYFLPQPVTIDVGYRLILDGVTYDVLTIERWDWHVQGVCARISVEDA